MPKEPQSIYQCPNRFSDACEVVYGECLREIGLSRELQFDESSDVARKVMSTYEGIVTHTQSWQNKLAVDGLESVFADIAKQRTNSVPKTVVCTGKTLLRQACSAVIVDVRR